MYEQTSKMIDSSGNLIKKPSFETISSKNDSKIEETTDSRSSRSDDSHFFLMKKKISPSNSRMRDD